MWIAKLKVRHDCILANRCRKFKVLLQSVNLNEEKAKKGFLVTSIHQMVGPDEAVKAFVNDLKKDARVKFLECNERTLFLVDSASKHLILEFSRKIFFVKPVIMDEGGMEYWEIASWDRSELSRFIEAAKKVAEVFELLSFKNTKLKDVYFPKVLPALTSKQKRAIELAVKNGYYQAPKKVGLRKLAKIMGISLATYQKHLQKAESKVIPDVLSYCK